MAALYNELGNFFLLLQELAELVHKVHLLCLLARGRLLDLACDDPLIQVVFWITFVPVFNVASMASFASY